MLGQFTAEEFDEKFAQSRVNTASGIEFDSGKVMSGSFAEQNVNAVGRSFFDGDHDA